MKKYIIPFIAIGLLFSCKDEDEQDETYSIPSTYNFDNVSYSGQTNRLDMLEELTAYIKTAHTSTGTLLDAQKMNDMYAAENAPFSDADLNTSTKNLKSKTYSGDVDSYTDMFDSIAKYSETTGASNGNAGIIETTNRIILVDANGMEYAQLIDKGLMGACFYYQATSSYLTDEKIGDAVDNTTVTEGEGTDKEHHFDEAFGYFGVPIDFPTNTEGIRFWGKYCDGRDELANTNQIMDAFLKGRAAISNKDQSAQDDAVEDIKMYWEKASAATAIHYLNDAVESFSDDADRCHVLTEAYAFIKALEYNIDASISVTKVQEVLNALGDNFWTITQADIESARDILATAADLESVKTEL